MAEIKWIKITTTMFDDEKLKLIDSMPERDTIFYIWIRLLAQAGKTNACGYIFLTENVPFTDEMLSTIFNRPLNSVRLALQTLRNFGMIDILDNQLIKITNWEKHQNVEGMEKVREQNRVRKQKQREKERILLEPAKGEISVTNEGSHMMSRDCHATEEDKEQDKDLDIDSSCSSKDPLEEIINYYCNEAMITQFSVDALELEAANNLLEKIPIEVIKQGIDEAFKNYKPKFHGDRIKSFKYCEPVIRSLWAKITAKKEVSIGGSNSATIKPEYVEGIGFAVGNL